MFRNREATIRTLSYVGLAVLTIATIALVVSLVGSPGWDGPFLNSKR